MTASPNFIQIRYLSKFSVGEEQEGVFFFLVYTYNLFKSELSCREVKIKSFVCAAWQEQNLQKVSFFVSWEAALAGWDLLCPSEITTHWDFDQQSNNQGLEAFSLST